MAWLQVSGKVQFSFFGVTKPNCVGLTAFIFAQWADERRQRLADSASVLKTKGSDLPHSSCLLLSLCWGGVSWYSSSGIAGSVKNQLCKLVCPHRRRKVISRIHCIQTVVYEFFCQQCVEIILIFHLLAPALFVCTPSVNHYHRKNCQVDPHRPTLCDRLVLDSKLILVMSIMTIDHNICLIVSFSCFWLRHH